MRARTQLLIGILTLWLGACSSLPNYENRVPAEAFSHPEETRIGAWVAEQAASHPGQSGFAPLPGGTDAMAARYALADLAEHSLDLQYYMVRLTVTSAMLLDRVWLAAQRGVSVRLLIDDSNAVGHDDRIAAFNAHPNIQVRVFNPFLARGPDGIGRLFEFIGEGSRLNRRMHNKLWIADNAAAVVGGRNLADEYFSAPGETNFLDLDLLSVGPVVSQISRSFDEYWNSEWSVPFDEFVPIPPELRDATLAEVAGRFETLRNSDAAGQYADEVSEGELVQKLQSSALELDWGPATALWDKPAKLKLFGAPDPATHLGPNLEAVTETAQHSLVLVSPYFVPGEAGCEALAAMVRRGVAVTVLTNSLASSDVALVHTGYARYRECLLQGGVALHELRALVDADLPRGPLRHVTKLSLHAKAAVVDERTVVVGSFNLDPRSVLHNTEFAVAVESEDLARSILARVQGVLDPSLSWQLELHDGALQWHGRNADGDPEVLDHEPDTWPLERMGIWFLGLFTPELLL